MYRILILLVLIVFYQFCFGQIQNNTKEGYQLDTTRLNETLTVILDNYQGYLPLHPMTLERFSRIRKNKEFIQIFYNHSPIYQYPDKDSEVIETLNFGDSVYTPQFNYLHENYSMLFVIDPTIGSEISHPDFYLCVTKFGGIGFIHSYNLIWKELRQDSTFTLYYGGNSKSALVNLDHSKIKYFNSNNLNKLFQRNIYIYSVINDFFSIENAPIYLFNADTWKEKLVTNGNNPIFLNDSIFVYYQFWQPSDVDSQVISLYNINTDCIDMIFSPPAGYSLVFRGDDYDELSQLIIRDEGSTITFYITEINDTDYLDVPYFQYTINLKGEVLSRERKQ